MKQVLVSSIVTLALAALFTDAIAAPPAPAPAPAAPARNVAVELAIRDGNDARTYQLTAMTGANPSCVSVRDRAADAHNEIELCLRAATSADLQVEVSWKIESNRTSFETRTAALVTPGTPLELGGKQRRLVINVQ